MNTKISTSFHQGLLVGAVICALTGCSKSFQTVGDSLTGNTTNSGLSTVTDPTSGHQVSPDVAWQSVSTGANGAVDGGSDSGTLVIQVDKADQAIVLYLPLPSVLHFPFRSVACRFPSFPEPRSEWSSNRTAAAKWESRFP